MTTDEFLKDWQDRHRCEQCGDFRSDVYRLHTESGEDITVWIEQDCGMVRGQYGQWHKVIVRPIGFNNCPRMIVDFDTLGKVGMK